MSVRAVWIVGQLKDLATGDWELGGVFSTYEKAVEACTHVDDCVWQEELDAPIPRETSYPAVHYWPLRTGHEPQAAQQ